MKRTVNYCGRHLATITALTALAGVLVSPALFASQPPQGPGGPGGGQGGPGGPGGRRGGGRPRPMSVAMVPAKALSSALSLTATQTTAITAVQNALEKERLKLMPAPGAPPAAPPDRETMQANRQKMREMDTKATSDIEALLTPEQKAALPDLMKAMDALGRAGVPPEVFGDLKLTMDQRKQLAALPAPPPPPGRGGNGGNGGAPPNREAMDQARKQAEDKVMVILTADQKKMIEAYRLAHPMPRPGDGGPPPPRPGDAPPPPPSE